MYAEEAVLTKFLTQQALWTNNAAVCTAGQLFLQRTWAWKVAVLESDGHCALGTISLQVRVKEEAAEASV